MDYVDKVLLLLNMVPAIDHVVIHRFNYNIFMTLWSIASFKLFRIKYPSYLMVVLAELLPGAPLSFMDDIKTIIADNQVLLNSKESDKTFEEIAHLLFDGLQVMVVDPIQFFCGCSKEMFYPMLYSLDKKELTHTYENGKSIEIVCNVYGKKYSFNAAEINHLL